MAKLVSKTYGEALFELAVEESKLDAFYEEVSAIRLILEQNPEFSKLMNHPKIDKDEKLAVVENVFGGRIDKELVGFLRLIVAKDRYDEIADILAYFLDRVKTEKGIGVAFVKSAGPLTDAQKKAVEERLLETTQFTQMEMTYEVDPSLIGGLVIRIGDRVVDSSIQTKLNELKKQLMKIQLSS